LLYQKILLRKSTELHNTHYLDLVLYVLTQAQTFLRMLTGAIFSNWLLQPRIWRETIVAQNLHQSLSQGSVFLL